MACGSVKWILMKKEMITCTKISILISELTQKYKRNKRLRYLKYQRHLRQLWTITRHHSIFPPVEYVNKIYVHGHFCERKIPYYRRYSENHGGIGRRFCKKLSNRRIRHYKKGISKGGNYKKIYDYQWAIE